MEPFALTVVVPCLNEAENIDAVYREIVTELGGQDGLEVLFIDDGSTDDTLPRIKDLARRNSEVSYLSLTRNFGVEAAFSAGYRYARHPWILHLDADLQFPPAEARLLIARARDGYDAVFGVRVDRKDPWVRRAASAAHGWAARRLLGIEIPPNATTFRLVRAGLARRVVDLGLGTPYFLATVPRLTSAWTTVPTAHRPRLRGSSKVTVRGLARHAMELFVGFSYRPLAVACALSLLGAPAALAAGACFLAGAPAAGAALLAAATAAGLAALAVMGRYLMVVARGQPRPPQFLIRAANVPVRPGDSLDPPSLDGAASAAGGCG
ncbi:glycosyl transferase [Sphaerisporangium rufum]|uniref:Glycosyl transferase n=1 Tax=Sphaerisporangium rufum TaxID=1381558 RepID=A0A919R2E7_9ACTN|nr:glycosyltransferase family 2 protein [Sphaerisporangium rufum]GII78471.1 glycosyl transferase [Sphaerisporangium rufum]